MSSDIYSTPVAKRACIFEGTECGDDGIGVDCNAGQVADSVGEIHQLTDTPKIENRIRFL